MTGHHVADENGGQIPSAPGSENLERKASEAGLRKLEVFFGLVALVILAFTLIDQIRDHHNALATGLVVALLAFSIVLMFLAWDGSIGHGLSPVLLFRVGLASLLVGASVLVFSPDPSASGSGPSTTKSNGATDTIPESSSTTQVRARDVGTLKTLLTVPDMTGRCKPGRIVLTTTSDPNQPPAGGYALAAGSQISLLLQSTAPDVMVIQRISTVVERRGPATNGRAFSLPAGCQGIADEDFYVANLTGDGGNVDLNMEAPRSDALPITVSPQDPVIVYILLPSVVGSVQWHIDVTWIADGVRHTSTIFDRGKPLTAST